MTVFVTDAWRSLLAAGAQQSSGTIDPRREEAYRTNNIGVALLEQYDYGAAVETFRRALRSAPDLGMARVNLAIALFYDTRLEDAEEEARAALEAMPEVLQPHYMLGLIARAQNRPADAIASFERVLQGDPDDVGAAVNLGQVYLQERRYEDAARVFGAAFEHEPYNATAAYNLAIALTRAERQEEGHQMMQRFQALRESGYATTLSQTYLEQGKYAEALASTGAEPELVDPRPADVIFRDVTPEVLPEARRTTPTGAGPRAGLSGRRVTAEELAPERVGALLGGLAPRAAFFDFNGDGLLDLFEVGPHGQRLLRNEGGRFVDVTEKAGLAELPAGSIGIGAVAGDYDNDGLEDLFVLRYGRSSLYRNEGNGRFVDVTEKAGLPDYPYLALSAAMLDVDHDGDLDIFIAGFVDLRPEDRADAPRVFPDGFPGAPNLLLRNNGNGSFSDITEEAGLTGGRQRGVALGPSDYDNRRDIDILVVNHREPPVLFKNMRDGTFRDEAAEAGLAVDGEQTALAVGDVNKDGFTDFFFGRADAAGLFAISDGRGRFRMVEAPPETAGALAAQFGDYDNNGLVDLIVATTDGVRVIRNLGDRWTALAEPVAQTAPAPGGGLGSASLGIADVDGSGTLDLAVGGGDLRIWRSRGDARHHSLAVGLAGRVSNRSGIGSKVEIRAGSLWQKLEKYSVTPAPAPAELLFGLGRRTREDVVRVLWPAGILQAETEFEVQTRPGGGRLIEIAELDRKPSSCPYLFTWNGERFEFVTDFLGGGEIGYWLAPGVWNTPDPDEYVRITGDQLTARHGRYELRITNELEEALFVDRVELVAVDHPAGVEVYPDEGLRGTPPEFKLYAVGDARPPVAAVDRQGRDVLDRIKHVDRRYVDDLPLLPIRGYAEPHTLTLDLGPAGDGGVPDLLLLTGWTDYAFSRDNVAAHQAGMSLQPPVLQVRDASGAWQTVVEDVGIPVGRPQTLVVDLTGKFPSASREVRLVTNMRIYWDRILVAVSETQPATRLTRLDPISAELRWRGFSAEHAPDGREPFIYDYDRVSPTSPWKVMPGRYTREGDVRELLLETNDMFVISRPGDEIALSFDAGALPDLPEGWTRTFLLYAHGFSKEMDPNSATPHEVEPLPFRGMTRYPYSAPERYPDTEAHRRYREHYNTRIVPKAVPAIETSLPEAYPRSALPVSESAGADDRRP
jgi:Flp pilus assembly protein TadD